MITQKQNHQLSHIKKTQNLLYCTSTSATVNKDMFCLWSIKIKVKIIYTRIFQNINRCRIHKVRSRSTDHNESWCGLQWADTRTNTPGTRLQATYDMKSHNITSPNKFVWIQNNLRTKCKGETPYEGKKALRVWYFSYMLCIPSEETPFKGEKKALRDWYLNYHLLRLDLPEFQACLSLHSG